MQQQLALTARRVVGPGALRVLGNVNGIQPCFTGIDESVAVDQACTPHPQRLDLGATQHEASLKCVFDRVVVPRLAVGRNDFLALFFWHGSPPARLNLGMLRLGGTALQHTRAPAELTRRRRPFATQAERTHVTGKHSTSVRSA
jgi:hypothetical protein